MIDVDHAAALFNLERGGHIYSRISNPTVAVLEERVAALEGGTAAIATSSGMSANFLAVMTLCEAGDHLVVSSQLYGGTVNLFRLTLPKFGINCTFVKPRDTEGFKNAIQENTKAIFGELTDSGLTGMLHYKEISYEENIEDLKKFKKNDIIDVKIIEIKDDKIFELAIDAGADECFSFENFHEIHCGFEDIYSIKKKLSLMLKILYLQILSGYH